jgi:vitamin K-dependent gamma-carboxylase
MYCRCNWAETGRWGGYGVYSFNIGVFPIIMMCALVLFIPPSAVKRFWILLSGSDAARLEVCRSTPPSVRATQARGSRGMRHTATVAALLAMAAFHVAFPLRHFALYPSNPSWTEEGHHGAWHMMLRSKRGWAMLHAVDVHGRVRERA